MQSEWVLYAGTGSLSSPKFRFKRSSAFARKLRYLDLANRFIHSIDDSRFPPIVDSVYLLLFNNSLCSDFKYAIRNPAGLRRPVRPCITDSAFSIRCALNSRTTFRALAQLKLGI